MSSDSESSSGSSASESESEHEAGPTPGLPQLDKLRIDAAAAAASTRTRTLTESSNASQADDDGGGGGSRASRRTDDDDEDVFSSGEEEMMQRMMAMRSSKGTSGRRMSSLDVYLLQQQQKEETISYVLKSKEKLHEVIEEVHEFEEAEARKLTMQKKEDQRRQLDSDKKRMEIIMARLQKNDDRRRESVLHEIAQAKIEQIKKRGERKKFQGLTREKRARLKQLLMQKAKEEFHNEQMAQLNAKNEHVRKVCPPLELDKMDDAQLNKLVRDLHARALRTVHEIQEWEDKCHLQLEEMHDIMQEMQEKDGRFMIPVLRKVKRNPKRKYTSLYTSRAMAASAPVVNGLESSASSTSGM